MPTGYTPIYKIMKGTTDVTDNFNDRSIEIEVILKGGNGDADTCKITVDDRDWRVESVEVGDKLEIYLGYKEVGLAQQGVFEINTVDYVINPRQIEITGNSVGFTGAIKAPAIKNFENKTLGDIIGQIAGSKGLTPIIGGDFAGIKLPFVNQTSSPLHLMHELERRFGALAKVEDGRLIFTPRDGDESAGGAQMPVLVLRPEHMSKGFVRHTQRSEYDSVKVGYFDENHIKKYAEEQGGAGNSQSTDGGEDKTPFLSKQLGRTKEEAERMAKSQMSALKRQQGEAHLWLAKGNPWIRDQMRVLLQHFRPKIDGSYVNDTVTHTFTKEPGIMTQILAKPPGTGEDYTSLDEGEFFKLGTGGVVGDLGPEQPKPNLDPLPGSSEENSDNDGSTAGETPVQIEAPINT